MAAFTAGTGAQGCAPGEQSPPPMAGLLRRVAQNGDADAFRSLFQMYAPRVKAYMMRHGADAAAAEELAQETLLAVWRKARLYSEGKGSATAWIFAIARNLRIDRLRREVPWQELPENHSETPSGSIAPEEALIAEERKNRLRAALAKLPPEQREVVLLSYLEGLPHSAIAGKLGVPPGTVKSRMRLAYQKMREAVEDRT